MDKIDIIAVASPAELDRFIKLPALLYANDPAFVPPLVLERREALSPAKNPYFQHAETQFWLARRDGRDVGRISAQIDRLVADPDVGHFGMIAAEDDAEVFAALFGAAACFTPDQFGATVAGTVCELLSTPTATSSVTGSPSLTPTWTASASVTATLTSTSSYTATATRTTSPSPGTSSSATLTPLLVSAGPGCLLGWYRPLNNSLPTTNLCYTLVLEPGVLDAADAHANCGYLAANGSLATIQPGRVKRIYLIAPRHPGCCEVLLQHSNPAASGADIQIFFCNVTKTVFVILGFIGRERRATVGL